MAWTELLVENPNANEFTSQVPVGSSNGLLVMGMGYELVGTASGSPTINGSTSPAYYFGQGSLHGVLTRISGSYADSKVEMGRQYGNGRYEFGVGLRAQGDSKGHYSFGWRGAYSVGNLYRVETGGTGTLLASNNSMPTAQDGSFFTFSSIGTTHSVNGVTCTDATYSSGRMGLSGNFASSRVMSDWARFYYDAVASSANPHYYQRLIYGG